jgi:hypothetical protein
VVTPDGEKPGYLRVPRGVILEKETLIPLVAVTHSGRPGLHQSAQARRRRDAVDRTAVNRGTGPEVRTRRPASRACIAATRRPAFAPDVGPQPDQSGREEETCRTPISTSTSTPSAPSRG